MGGGIDPGTEGKQQSESSTVSLNTIVCVCSYTIGLVL